MALLAAVNPQTDVHPALPRLLNKISSEQLALQALDRYYTGSQPLSFLAPEVQRAVQGRLRSLVINWPRLVVNSIEERIKVEGFRVAADQPADDSLWRIWQANRLSQYSHMAHTDALVHGRSFAIVWPDPQNPAIPRISVESSEQMTVEFEPGTYTVTAAAKHWAQDDMAYATLYLADSVERYVAPMAGPGMTSGLAAVGGTGWELREDPIPHDLGVVPVVPIVNRPRLTHPYGESELTDVLPMVDAINKLATDMMVSAEFHAMPRRYATGIDLGDGEGSEVRAQEMVRQRWTEAAAGRVWLSDDPNSRFGQFPEATLDNFIKGIEMLAAQIAAVAALPPHYVGLMSQANPASADAIRSSEASLSFRARGKFTDFGESWISVMKLALLVRDGTATTDALEVIWRDPETPTVSQRVDAAVKLDGVGMPFRQTLEDLGYTPVQIERAIRMRTTDALADVRAQLEDVDMIVKKYGLSRAGALAVVGLDSAAQVEARVEVRQPGPGVTSDAEFVVEQNVGAVRVVGAPAKPAVVPPVAPPRP